MTGISVFPSGNSTKAKSLPRSGMINATILDPLCSSCGMHTSAERCSFGSGARDKFHPACISAFRSHPGVVGVKRPPGDVFLKLKDFNKHRTRLSQYMVHVVRRTICHAPRIRIRASCPTCISISTGLKVLCKILLRGHPLPFGPIRTLHESSSAISGEVTESDSERKVMVDVKHSRAEAIRPVSAS